MAAIDIAMKKFSLFLALLLVTPLLALAGDDGTDDPTPGNTIYKTVGPDGQVIFSDTPPADSKAEKVEVGPTNVQPIVAPRPLPTRKLSPRDRDRQDDQGPFNFTIVSPQSGTTITPGQRFIVLEVAVNPVPRDGYRFFAVVDGRPWVGSSSGTSLDLSALERGTHQIQAVLTDLSGNPLAQSQTITLYVKRPSVDAPANPAPQAPQAPRAQPAPAP